MDGPAVNYKFLDNLKTDLQHINSDCELLSMGSCGLHVVHGVLQTGHKASSWNVNSVLRALYTLFKDSPARQADYIRIIACSVFPKKFRQVRWAENAVASNRALEVFDNVKKYVAETGKQLP